MSSITACLRKTGAKLDPADQELLIKIRDEHVASGMDPKEANVRAVNDMLEIAQQDKASLVEQIRKAGGAVDGLLPEPKKPEFFPGSRVSTRYPTGVTAKESPLTTSLNISVEAMKLDREKFALNADLVRHYKLISEADAKLDDDAVVEKFIEHVVDNLLWLHDKFKPELRSRAKLWYVGARTIADRFASRFGVSSESAAGIMAVLSPQKDWFENVTLAERVMDAMRNRQDFAWTPEMTDMGYEIIWADSAKQKKLWKFANLTRVDRAKRDALEQIKGKKLRELTDPYLKAVWIRIYDQTYNPNQHRIITPEGEFAEIRRTKEGKGPIQKLRWGGFDSIAKAVRIFEDGSFENISKQLGDEHKVRNFYNNIIAPNATDGDVTIDTHAVAAAQLLPLSGESIPVSHNFGSSVKPADKKFLPLFFSPVPAKINTSNSSITGANGLYGIYADAYRRAAEKRGVLPREMQSITWEAVRGLFEAKQKDEDLLNLAVGVWDKYHTGSIDLAQARQEILNAAGEITDPSWARPGQQVAVGQRLSSYAGDVAGDGVPGRDTGAVDAGAGDVAAAAPEAAGVGFRESNAARTQRQNTVAAYQGAAKNFTETDTVIDYGAGFGMGRQYLPNYLAFEPFPQGDRIAQIPGASNPDFTDRDALMAEWAGKADGVVSNLVLNVVPKGIRDSVVQDIGALLRTGGKAYIATRSQKDVDAAKSKTQLDDGWLVGDGDVTTFQKGFTQKELEQYVQSILGSDFKVAKSSHAPKGNPQVEIVRLSGSPVFSRAGYQTMMNEARKVSEALLATLPDEVRADIEVVDFASELPFDAPSDVQGAYWRGKVYLVRAAMRSEKAAKTILAHELVGHYGIEKLLGAETFDAVVKLVLAQLKSGNKTFQGFADQIRKDYGNIDDRTLAREIIAHMAEKRFRHPILMRVIAAVKQWLAKIGITDPSTALVEDLIARAARFVQRPDGAASPLVSDALLKRIQKDSKEMVESLEFKRWFGDSKVVDTDGSPLVVFHGATRNVEGFDDRFWNPSNYFGGGHYFTDSTEDANENYATRQGPDLVSRIGGLADQIENDILDSDIEINDDDVLSDYLEHWFHTFGKDFPGLPGSVWGEERFASVVARWAATVIFQGENRGVVYPVYLSLQNPVDINKTFFQIEVEYDDDGELVSEGGNYLELVEAFRDSLEEVVSGDLYDAREIDRIVASFMDLTADMAYDGFTIDQLLKAQEKMRGGHLDSINWLSQRSALGEGHSFRSVLRHAFEKMGYDGIIMSASRFKMRGTGGAFHYIAFSGTQVKSAVGNRGTFDPNVNDLVLSKMPNVWFSPLMRAVDGINAKAAPAKSWLQQINALVNKGVKQEEIEWSGVTQWLQRMGDQRISKEQLQYFLAEHAVQLDEIVLWGPTKEDFDGYDVFVAENDEIAEGDNPLEEPVVSPESITLDFSPEIGGNINQTLLDLSRKTDRQTIIAKTPIGTYRIEYDPVDATAFEPDGSGIPGRNKLKRRPSTVFLDGEPVNGIYAGKEITRNDIDADSLQAASRALIFQVPDNVNSPIALANAHFRQHAMQEMYGQKASSFSRNNAPKFSYYRANKKVLSRGYKELLITLPSGVNVTPKGESVRKFYGGHWTEKGNVLAHTRFQTVIDASGRKVLLVQEIQSDWHQEGRKKGYGRAMPDGWTAALMDKNRELVGDSRQPEPGDKWVVRNESGRMMGHAPIEDAETADAAIERIATIRGVGVTEHVPDAPFKKSWPMLVMKRIIRHAVEEGFDSIAWTTGEQQANLYNLRNYITGISWESVVFPPGIGPLQGEGYNLNIVTENNGIIHRSVMPDQLEGFVGKELAEKIRAKDEGELKGLDLEVGGSGMIGFYDKILPMEVEKLTKRWGGRVEKRFLEDDMEVGADAWFLDLTDKMRDAASEGLPVFSRGGGFSLPKDMGLWDKIVTRLQNKTRALMRTQDEIGVTLGDEDIDVSLMETLYPGRVRARTDQFEKDYVKTITDAIKQGGYTFSQVGQFLHARHAKEANAVLERRNPGRRNNQALSGMTDLEADQILMVYQGDPVMQLIGQTVDLINSERRDILVNEDLAKLDEIQAWESLYQHYVPLNREDTEAVLPPRGRGFDVRGKNSAFRAGSNKPVDWDNLLARVFAQYEATVMRAEKNKVGQTLYELVQENPNPDFWRIDELPTNPFQRADGTASWRETTLPANVFGVKFGGEQHWIVFNEQNEYAMGIARALKNLGDHEQNVIVQGLHTINRFLSAVNTSLSPEFVISNFARDLQTAMANLSDTDANGHAGAVVRGLPSALRGIRNALRGDGTHAWAQLFREFESEGGMTGWMQHYESLDDKTKQIRRQMLVQSTAGLKQAKQILDFIGDYNSVAENGVRLSAYRTARDLFINDGMSQDAARKRAAQLAKELTVNFNRRGEWGVALNGLYLFYNASIQGSARMIRAIVRSKKARAISGAVVIGAMVLDVMMRAMADDDKDGKNFYDRIPNHIKDRNLVIMDPSSEKGEFFQIPLPWGYNVFHVMGQEMGSAMSSMLGMKPDYKLAGSAGRVLGSVLEAFNPINSGTLAQTIAPTVLDPAVSVWENRTWNGSPLYPQRFREDEPNWTKYYSSAREGSKWLAEKLNAWTGGDLTYPGVINWSPEWIDLGLDTVMGSAGRFLIDTANTIQKVFTGEKLEAKNIPLWRKVVGDQSPSYARSEYYENLEEVLAAERNMKAYKGKPEYAGKVERAGPLRTLIPAAKASQKRTRDLRKDLNSALEAGEKERADKIQERMDAEMKRFLKIYWDRLYGD